MVIELKPRKTRKKRGLSIFSRIVSHCICVVSHRVVSCRVVLSGELKSETLALNQEPKHSSSSRKESVRELEKKHFH